MGYVVRREDGSALSRVEATEIRPTSLGNLNRMIGFPLENAPPGNYELVMNFQDQVTGHDARGHGALRDPGHGDDSGRGQACSGE